MDGLATNMMDSTRALIEHKVRLPRDLSVALAQRAEDNGRSLSAEVRVTLRRSIAAQIRRQEQAR